MNVDIEVGTLFKWADDSRSVLVITPDPIDLPVRVHDGFLLAVKRPKRWWYLLSWLRVVRALWRMPFTP